MQTVIITILMFIAIILIHEFGHFITAKMFKVQVNEFSIGMGPKLFQKKGKETVYSVRALPIGGYVSMEGEDNESENPRAFCNQKAWKRFIIVSAGAILNLLLGFILVICIISPKDSVATNTIAQFRENSVSQDSGLQVGDTIKKINGRSIFVEADIVNQILSSNSSKIDFVVERDGKKIQLNDVEFKTEKSENSEKEQLYIDFLVASKENSIINTLDYSFRYSVSLGRMIWFSFIDLITGKVGFDQLSGPVGVGEAVGQAIQYGLSSVLLLIAFLTINIGIFNLLPIPALDGGRIFFILIEMIFRRPINKKYEGYVHFVGIVLLLGLMLVVTLKDIYKLF